MSSHTPISFDKPEEQSDPYQWRGHETLFIYKISLVFGTTVIYFKNLHPFSGRWVKFPQKTYFVFSLEYFNLSSQMIPSKSKRCSKAFSFLPQMVLSSDFGRYEILNEIRTRDKQLVHSYLSSSKVIYSHFDKFTPGKRHECCRFWQQKLWSFQQPK